MLCMFRLYIYSGVGPSMQITQDSLEICEHIFIGVLKKQSGIGYIFKMTPHEHLSSTL